MLRSEGYKMSKLARIALLSIMFICVNASEDETQGVYKYEYDKNGNVIAENKSDLEGELLEKYEYKCCKYDSNGKVIEKSGVFEDCTYAESDRYDLKYEYKYDSKGKLIEENLYLYDTRGNVVEENKTTYKYDSRGNKIEKYYLDVGGIGVRYTYDVSGKVIEKYYPETTFGEVIHKYEYDFKKEESSLYVQVYEKKEIFIFRGKSDEPKTTKLHFVYDTAGVLREKSEYGTGYLNWKLSQREIYDQNGNLIEKRIYW